MNKTVGFIGSGKIVHSLIPALIKNDFTIEFVIGNNQDELKSLKNNYSIKTTSSSIENIKDCDLIFVAVPDSKISEISQNISELEKDFSSAIFIHLSGSGTIEELKSLSDKNILVAGFHPMQSFPSYNSVPLKNVYAAVETENKNIFDKLSAVAEQLKMIPFQIFPDQKTAYHLMGVMVSNFMTANFFNADKLFPESKNIPASNKLLSTIATQTLENIIKSGSVNSLSGPIERGDLETVQKHLELLKNTPSQLSFYISSSLTLCEIALKKGSITESGYNDLINLLKKYS